MNQELLTYISKSPTQFQAMETSARMLLDCGAVELHEEEKWELVPGKTYFTTRNGSSLIAWKMLDRNFAGYLIEASHLDSPYLKIKENAEEEENGYIRLSVERYGGMLLSTWLDRPLSSLEESLSKQRTALSSARWISGSLWRSFRTSLPI